MKKYHLALGAAVLLATAGIAGAKVLPGLHEQTARSFAAAAVEISSPVIVPHSVTVAQTAATSSQASKTSVAKPKAKPAVAAKKPAAKTVTKSAGTSRLITKNAPLIDPSTAPGTR